MLVTTIISVGRYQTVEKRIVDVNGKEMYIDKTILTSPLIEIPIQQLPIGVYLLSVETEQSFSVQKL